MSQIFHEVEEEVRRERLLALWKSYGWLLITGLVLLVGGVAGHEIWDHYTTQSKAQATSELLDASAPLDLNNYQEALDSLKAAEPKLTGDIKGLAAFRMAQARIGEKDITGAVATLDGMAADDGISKTLRELATIYSAYLQLDKASFDEINSHLAPLVNENSIWRYSAMNLIGFSALSNGKTDVARQQFQALANDAGAPQEIRQRAQTTLEALGAPEDTNAAPPAEAPKAASPQDAAPAAPAKEGK